MKYQTRQKLIRILMIILLSMFGLEVMLRTIDPLGTWTLRSVNIPDYLNNIQGADRTGYSFKQGNLMMGTYHATILADGSRRVPDTNIHADCQIAFIGDSVTFGWGVEDSETFVNLIAEKFPNIHFLNTARPGYNAGNIARLIPAYPASAYIYLAIDNDNQYPTVYKKVEQQTMPLLAMQAYIGAYVIGQGKEDPHYLEDIQRIIDAHALLLGFAYDQKLVLRNLPFIYLPYWTYSISKADGHPNAQGHQAIANAMLPYVQDYVNQVC